MSTTAPAPASTSEIITRADSELASLATQRAEAYQRVRTGQAALEDLHATRQAQAAQARALHEHLAQAQATHTQASTYANLAQGTLQEKSALAKLKDARSTLKAAEKHAAEMEKLHTAEETSRREKEEQIAAALREDQSVIADTGLKIEALQLIRAEAHQQAGRDTFQRVTEALRSLEEQIEKHGHILIESKLELASLADEAIDLLKDWPELQRQAISEHQLISDPVTRVLHACVQWLDLFDDLSPHIERRIGDASLFELLSLSPAELAMMLDYRGPNAQGTRFVEARRTAIQEALKAYTRVSA